VLFVDAAHFLYGPVLGFVWCLARLFVAAPAGRKRYNVLAALDPVSHRLIRVTNATTVGADAVCELLRAVAGAGLGRPITLVLDNARYQHTAAVKALAGALGIELLYLPSYSPNLNLIERVWKFVKKEVLASRYLESFGAFTAAIDECLDHLETRHKDQMRSLLTLNFQTFGDEPILAA
jgi:transposase